MSEPNAFERVLARTLSFDNRYVDVAITIAFLTLLVVLLEQSFGYELYGRMFPIAIIVPTILFLLVLLAIQTIPRAGRLADRLTTSNVLDTVGNPLEEDDADDEPDGPSVEGRWATLVLAVWIALLMVAISALGFLYGVLVFLVAFYSVESNLGPVRSLLLSVVVYGFVFVVFDEVLNTRWNEGWLWELLPFLS